MTVALIVLFCTVLFGGLMTSRSYLERFEDASGNPVPAPTAQKTEAPLQVMPYTNIMAPSMQMPMQMPMQMQMQPMMVQAPATGPQPATSAAPSGAPSDTTKKIVLM